MIEVAIKGLKHLRHQDPNDCDVDNEFPLVTQLDFVLQKQKHSLVMHAGGKEWSM